MNKENEIGELPPIPAKNPKYADTQPINLMVQSNTNTDLETSVQNAEKFVKLQDSIRKMAIQVTNVHDWVDQGGKPYLEEHGAQKIAMAFGVSIQNVRSEMEERKDDKGPMITYYYHGEASWQGRIVPQLGTCSTRDPFFGQKGGKLLPLSEVKLVDVRKKAYTNMLNRSIKSCLGLSYTWDELSDASGGRISQQTVLGAGKGVSYNKGSQGGSTKPPETQVDKDKKTEVWNMLMDLYGSKEGANEALERATAFTNKEGKEIKGKSDISKISVKQIGFLYDQIKEAHTKHMNNLEKQGEAQDFFDGTEDEK